MLREFDKRSKHFPLGDQFINSYNLISGQSVDMVRRKLMLVTTGTLRFNRLTLYFSFDIFCAHTLSNDIDTGRMSQYMSSSMLQNNKFINNK